MLDSESDVSRDDECVTVVSGNGISDNRRDFLTFNFKNKLFDQTMRA